MTRSSKAATLFPSSRFPRSLSQPTCILTQAGFHPHMHRVPLAPKAAELRSPVLIVPANSEADIRSGPTFDSSIKTDRVGRLAVAAVKNCKLSNDAATFHVKHPGCLISCRPALMMGPMTQPDNGDRRARSIFDRLRSPTAAVGPAPAEVAAPTAPDPPSEADEGGVLNNTNVSQSVKVAAGEIAAGEVAAGEVAAGNVLADQMAADNDINATLGIRRSEDSEKPLLADDRASEASNDPDLASQSNLEAAKPIPEELSASAVTSADGVPTLAVPADLDRLLASLDNQHCEETAPGSVVPGSVVPGSVAPGSVAPGELDEYGRALHPSSLAHDLPRRIAVANQKGGVGKTTTTVNVGASLAELGYRVLVVDLDPQGNATTGLGVNARSLESSIYDVLLHDVPVDDVIEPTSMRNLFVVPATIDLAGAEIELVPVFSRELRLKRAIDSIAGDFDFVLIDCPPSLGLLTVNAMAAAGEVLVPIQCEYYALEGLGQLLRNVNLVKANLNAGLDVSVIVLTMYDARTKLAEQVANEVRDHFGGRVCRSVIPRTVRLSEAPSFGRPITTFDPSSRGAIAYRELAKEVSGGAKKRIG